jgi:hypothetical protein
MTTSLVCYRTQTDKARVNETKSIEKAAGPLQVVIFTPAGTGGQGGIVRMMDELRCALQVDRFAKIKIKVCFITQLEVVARYYCRPYFLRRQLYVWCCFGCSDERMLYI